jgi:hypothetical protein
VVIEPVGTKPGAGVDPGVGVAASIVGGAVGVAGIGGGLALAPQPATRAAMARLDRRRPTAPPLCIPAPHYSRVVSPSWLDAIPAAGYGTRAQAAVLRPFSHARTGVRAVPTYS